MPMIVDRRAEVEHLQHDLQGRCYDLEYSLRYFHFNIISNIFIKWNIFLVQSNQ